MKNANISVKSTKVTKKIIKRIHLKRQLELSPEKHEVQNEEKGTQNKAKNKVVKSAVDHGEKVEQRGNRRSRTEEADNFWSTSLLSCPPNFSSERYLRHKLFEQAKIKNKAFQDAKVQPIISSVLAQY